MSLVDSIFQDAAAAAVAAGSMFAVARWGIKGMRNAVHTVVQESLVEKLDQNNHDTKAVLNQVRNSHSSNLRDDMDLLKTDLSDISRSMLRTERILFSKLDNAASAAETAAEHSAVSRKMLEDHITRSTEVEAEIRTALTEATASRGQIIDAVHDQDHTH